jgi:type I restriction enzyme S subunit
VVRLLKEAFDDYYGPVPDDTEFNVWVHVAVLKLVPSALPFYVQHMLNSPHCYAQSQRLTHGVGNQDLGLTRIVNITMPIMPREEQELIIDRVDVCMKAIKEIEQEAESAFTDLATLDQAILAKAFRGELVPQAPNDEPASALLARIREQRMQQAEAAKHKQKTSVPQRGNKMSEESSSLTPQQLTLTEILLTKD